MIDQFFTTIQSLNGFQRLLMSLGFMTLIVLLFVSGIVIMSVALFIYEDIVDKINERKDMRRLRKK